MGVFVSAGLISAPGTPCSIRKGEERRKKKEKFYIYLDVTHTPDRSRVNPERQEVEKADTDDGQHAETAQGGEGNERTSRTNLRGETDLPQTEHTPKPHDTLRRGTREEVGTKWGTSWWRAWKAKQLT